MAKTKRYTNFREFYEDEDRPKKIKPVNESKKDKDLFRKQFQNIDPNELDDLMIRGYNLPAITTKMDTH